MKRRIVVVVLGLIAMTAFADANRVWEGSAAVGRYGEFPPTGFYGASNSFPRNSIVDVTNLNNGKSVRLIISGGLADPSMFLVVSEQAADVLSVARNDAVRVRVAAVVIPGTDPGTKTQDLPYSPDPDVNPAARAGDANEVVNPRKNAGAAATSQPTENRAVLPQAVKSSAVSAAVEPAAQAAKTVSSTKQASVPQAEAKSSVPQTEAKPAPVVAASVPLAEKAPAVAPAEVAASAVKPSSVPQAEAKPAPVAAATVPVTETKPSAVVAAAVPSAEPVSGKAAGPAQAKPEASLAPAMETKPSSVPAADKSPQAVVPPLAVAIAAETKPVSTASGTEAKVAALPEEKKVEPPAARTPSDDDWARPAEVNRIDEAGALVSQRTPQKELFPKPRESEAFTVAEAPKAAAAPVVEMKKTPETPPPAPAVQPGGMSLGEEVKPVARFNGVEEIGTKKVEKTAEAVIPAETVKPIPVPSEAKVALVPAEMKPPVVPAPEVSSEKEKQSTEEALKKLDTIIASIPEKAEEKKAEEKKEETAPPKVENGTVGKDETPPEEEEEKPEEAEKAVEEEKPAVVEKKPEAEAVKTVPAAVAADEWAKENLPLVASLKKNSYYLQLVSYGNPKYAKNAVEALASFPIVVLPVAMGDKSFYRVLLGPVNEDEKGILLYKMRAQGFKDAFVRKGE